MQAVECCSINLTPCGNAVCCMLLDQPDPLWLCTHARLLAHRHACTGGRTHNARHARTFALAGICTYALHAPACCQRSAVSDKITTVNDNITMMAGQRSTAGQWSWVMSMFYFVLFIQLAPPERLATSHRQASGAGTIQQLAISHRQSSGAGNIWVDINPQPSSAALRACPARLSCSSSPPASQSSPYTASPPWCVCSTL